MPAAKLAVLVLFLTSRYTDALGAGAVTARRYDTNAALGTLLRAGAGWYLRAVGITSTNSFATQLGEAVAVGVGVALTVGEAGRVAAGATASGAGVLLGQSQTGERRSGCYTGDGAANAAEGCTAADFVIGQGFGYSFEPVCHRHLLMDWIVLEAYVLSFSTLSRNVRNLPHQYKNNRSLVTPRNRNL
jgi:hypothetical protein